jgi:integrase
VANLQLRLTEAICARSCPAEAEYAVRDLIQPNLSLRVRPNGARSWIVRSRVDGRQHKATLGTYPEMGLKAARKAASAFNGQPAPAPAPRKMPHFSTFQKEHELRHGASYKPSGLVSYKAYIRNQLLPAFRQKRLDAISRVDVVRWFEAYSLVSPGGANRALGILAQMLNCAQRWGYFSDDWINPASGVRHNRRKRVGTFLSMEQMERLGGVLSGQARKGCVASALIHVLALTGCRVGEIIHLEWGDVLDDRLRLRDSKTGARDVPLGASAYRYIKAMRKVAKGGPQGVPGGVFPLPEGNAYEAVRKVWKSVKLDADLPLACASMTCATALPATPSWPGKACLQCRDCWATNACKRPLVTPIWLTTHC